jgi:Skp family chaperone for outer membrane proteins
MNMFKHTIIGIVGMTALAFFATPTAAWAQAKKYSAPVVAVVDIQAVMGTSEAAKNIKTQIDKLRAGYQQTVQTKNEELRKLEAELQQQRAVLAPDAFQLRQRDFDQKIAEAQKDVQDRRAKIEVAFEKAMQTVETTVTQIVAQIAKENGITLVLPTQAVIHAEPDMNITAEVVKRLNARLTKVPIDVAK